MNMLQHVMLQLEKEGVLTLKAGKNVLRLLPPLTISQEEVDFALDKIAESFSGVGDWMKAAIVGITGYTGVELMRLIEQHPYLEIPTLHRSGKKASYLTEEFPHFLPLNAKIQAFDAKYHGSK